MARKLTAMQKRFCEEYLVDCNASAAAKRAGYSPRSAFELGWQLLQIPLVKEMIQRLQDERSARVRLKTDEILAELKVMGLSCVRNYVVDENGDVQLAEGVSPEAWRALSSIKHKVKRRSEHNVEIETEFRLWDKNTALANAGKHLGLFTEKVNVKHSNDPENPLPDGVNAYDVDDLGLPLDVRTQVLEAMKLKQARLRQGNAGDE